MFSYGKSCFGASWAYPFINHLGMSSRNHLLFHQYFTAHRAMFPLGKPCFGTGGLYSFIDNLSMPCGNNLLCLQNLTAIGAFLTFGETVFSAGWLYPCKCLLDMYMRLKLCYVIKACTILGACYVTGGCNILRISSFPLIGSILRQCLCRDDCFCGCFDGRFKNSSTGCHRKHHNGRKT